MNWLLQRVYGAVIGLGFLMIILAINDNSPSPLVASGKMAVGLILTIGGLVALFRLKYSSPAIRAQILANHKEVESMNFEELESFAGEELCSRFGIQKGQASQSLIKNLNTPHGEINTVLDDFQIDFGLPVSSDDSDQIQSVEDIVRLILMRRFSQ